jgi:hypothetical protein
MSSRKDDKPSHVEAARRRLEQAAKDRPEPRFGARRTRKPSRPADVRTVQPFLFDREVQE